MGGIALASAAVAGLVWELLPAWPLVAQAALVLTLHAGLYLLLTRVAGVSELGRWLRRPSRESRRKR
jgi:hypothetical protein